MSVKIISQIGSNESFSDRMNFQARLGFKIVDIRRSLGINGRIICRYSRLKGLASSENC